jgi:hypothetical protein
MTKGNGTSLIKTFLVELNFLTAPAALTQTNFNDQPQLRDKKIVGIEAIAANQLAHAPSGAAMATNANALNTALTLKIGTSDDISQMPFAQFITQNNGGIVREFFGIEINFQSSGINCFTTGITAAQSLCYNFYYVDKTNWNQYLEFRRTYGKIF